MKKVHKSLLTIGVVAIAILIGAFNTGLSYAYFSSSVAGAKKSDTATMETGNWSIEQTTAANFTFDGHSTNQLGWVSKKNSYANSSKIGFIYGDYYTNTAGNIFAHPAVTSISVTVTFSNANSSPARTVNLTVAALRSNGAGATNGSQTLSSYVSAETPQSLTFRLTPSSSVITGLKFSYDSDTLYQSWNYIGLYGIDVSYTYDPTVTSTSITPVLAMAKYVNSMYDLWNVTTAEAGDMVDFYETLTSSEKNAFATSANSTVSTAYAKYVTIRNRFASTYPL